MFYSKYTDMWTNKKYTPDTFCDVAQANMTIFEQEYYINEKGEKVGFSELKQAALSGQQLFAPTYEWNIEGRINTHAGEIEVTTESTLAAAHRLHVKEGHEKVLALNFASQQRPGGGYFHGNKTQEECLCRCSLLYNLISKEREMYDNNPRNAPGSDYMILSRDVPVIRGDDCEFLDSPMLISFLTSAAPRVYVAKTQKEVDECRKALEQRLRKIILCSIENGYDVLILGAFGCGAYGNDIADLARFSRKILIDEGLRFYFKKVVFAMLANRGKNLAVLTSELVDGTLEGCEPSIINISSYQRPRP